MPRRPPTSPLFLHDALPICGVEAACEPSPNLLKQVEGIGAAKARQIAESLKAARQQGEVELERAAAQGVTIRSEEHTSELQSQSNLVCRLLLEKKRRARWPR